MPTIASRPRDREAPPASGAQDEVLDFLSKPEHYEPLVASVGRIDTHCSSVFLVGDRAYKLKRAIRFASLDYGTVARRERACRAEIRLNARTTPRLYLGI